MKIAAIIAEYNPYHNGHAYLANEVRRLAGADYVIALMSGDYVQRGTPAIADQYVRASMAVSSGIDLVLAYPTRFSASSGESFARNAIALLNGLGCIDILAFGSECGDLQKLDGIAEILLNETEDFKEKLKKGLKEGLSYPSARAAALPEGGELLSSPNNILAVEYLKALKRTASSIRPLTVPRRGAGYHDITAGESLSSASALRHVLETAHENHDLLSAAVSENASEEHGFLSVSVSENPPEKHDFLSAAMPEKALAVLENHLALYPPVTEDDFSLILGEKLWQYENAADLTVFPDINADLAGRLIKKRPLYRSFSSFAAELKSKTFTRTRINRALLQLALDIKACPETENGLFGRVLGFRRECKDLPSLLCRHASIPVILRASQACHDLNEGQMGLFQEELRVSSLYELILSQKSGQMLRPELSRPLIVL